MKIDETIASRLLDDYRNLPVVDRGELTLLRVRVGDIVADAPQISELDLNPVIASSTSVLPVDVRVILSE